jgi:hypothetical protein
MAKYAFVISPRSPDLYADVARDFKGDPVVDVVLDRRVAERRIARVPHRGAQGDRRRRDRRINPNSHSDMAALGYVLVRVNDTSGRASASARA